MFVKMLRRPFFLMISVGILCALGCTHVTRGYFYVNAVSAGYVVAVDETPDNFGQSTYVVTDPMPLPQATALCDSLNRDLGSHARTKN